MKLLLDTHILVWSLLEPHRLSRRVARTLANADNEIWISPVTTWEVLMLAARGRIRIAGDSDPHRWMEEVIARTSFREAPLTHEIVMAMAKVELPHRDPADRFLAATALHLGLTLVTADENLIGGRGYPVMANR